MPSFSKNTSTGVIKFQDILADPDDFSDEPYFVMVLPNGAVGLVTLDYLRGFVTEITEEGRNVNKEYVEIYAKFPECSVLELVSPSIVERSGTRKLAVISETAVEYIYDL